MNNKVRTIIIDDEQLARSITKSYLSKHPEIEIVAECSNGFDAIKKINEEKPDLIFLDIQMPKINGFEMLELLDDPPAIIFTTAYDQFEIKAFEVSAVDYLLKPFSEERFNESLKKSYTYIKDKFQQNSAIKNIIEQNDERIEFLERVVIKEGSKISILPVESIKWIEAQDDYVMINSEQGRFLKKKTMRYVGRIAKRSTTPIKLVAYFRGLLAQYNLARYSTVNNRVKPHSMLWSCSS